MPALQKIHFPVSFFTKLLTNLQVENRQMSRSKRRNAVVACRMFLQKMPLINKK